MHPNSVRRLASKVAPKQKGEVISRESFYPLTTADSNLSSGPKLITYDIFEKKSAQQLLYESAQGRSNFKYKWKKFTEEVDKHINKEKYSKQLVEDLDQRKQWSALHYAVFNNNTFVCDQLTDKIYSDACFRCSINILTGNGENVLHIAARSSCIWQTTPSLPVYIDNEQVVLPSIIHTLIERGANVNHPDDEGRTPLHLAVMENRLNFVKYLLHHEADIYATTKLYANVLHFTFIPNGRTSDALLDMYGYLTRKLDPVTLPWRFPWSSAPVNLAQMRTFDNQTPLVFAACHPYTTGKIIRDLLEKMKENSEDSYNRSSNKLTFLQSQIFATIAQVARRRFQGYDHLQSILYHCTPDMLNQFFHFPCQYDNVNFLRWLIEPSPQLYDQPTPQIRLPSKLDLNQRDHAGYTPLLTAVFYKSTKCVQYLLQYSRRSVRTNTTASSLHVRLDEVNADGENILHICAKNSPSNELFNIVWDSTASLGLVRAKDDNGNLPLHVAAANNQIYICEKFLTAVEGSFGLLSMKNAQGQTAAHVATVAVPRRIGPEHIYIEKHEKGKHRTSAPTKEEDSDDDHNFGLPILQLMWDKSPKTDKRGGLFERDDDRMTCLHLAAAEGHEKIVKFLVEEVRLEVDVIADRRLTPLHLACEYGHGEIIAYLIEHGASPTLRTAEMYNSLEIAIMNQNETAVKELLTLPNWRALVSNAQRIDNSEGYDTPMRKLIRYMPEVTIWMIEEKLTRTLGGQGRHVFKKVYDYEFYMDMNQVKQWHTQGVQIVEEKESFSERCHRRGCTAICYCKCCCQSLYNYENNSPMPYTDDAYTLIRNHPLIIASEQSQCPALVQHPYNIYLRDQWFKRNKSFFQWTRALSFLLYAAFLAIWTALILLSKHPQYFYDKAGRNMTLDLDSCENVSRFLTATGDSEALKTTAYKNLKISLYAFLIFFVVENVILIIALFPRVFRTTDYIMEVSAFVLTFVYILDWRDWQSPVVFRCPIQHQIGSMGLLLAWIGMLSYVKRTTWFDMGVFVVMIQLIGFKFMRFVPVLIIIVCGFGFTHWMILQNQTPFQYPITAVIRTGLLMFDLGYEDHLYENTVYYQIIYVITILSAIVFCIFVLNLLISVAVGEIPSLTVQGKIWQSQVLYDLLSDYSIISIQIIRFSDFISCGFLRRWVFKQPLHGILTLEHDQKGNWHQRAWKYTQKNFFDEKIQDDVAQNKTSVESE